MYLLNYRITHHAAKIRELEATRYEKLEGFYEIFSKIPYIKECLILQTCNRNELYFIVEDLSRAMLKINETIRSPEKFESEWGLPVINHLFKIAAGIDSLVIGEDQILSQIKDAFLFAKNQGAIGPILTHIFQKALAVGKKVRNETQINRGAVSIGSIAVDYCRSIFNNLQDKVITVIGAGETGTLVAKALLKQDVKATFVSNRTHDRAIRLAKVLGGKALKLDDLEVALLHTDIIIVATAAPHPILTKEKLERVMKKRNGEQIVIIDISVPRNIEQGIEMPNLKIHDLDGLKEISDKNRLKRLEAIESVKQIIKDAIESEEKHFRHLYLKPLIASIYLNAEEIRKKELTKLIKMLDNLNSRDIQKLEDFSKALINKIFGGFSSTIKSDVENSLMSPLIL